MKKALTLLLATLFASLPLFSSVADDKLTFEEISFSYHHSGKAASRIKRKAAFFPAEGSRAIILAHQWGAEKESWYFFSDLLQKRNLSSVALQYVGTDDVLGAIEFLKSKGYSDITLMGASLGGGAIMRAMDTQPELDISKIILLAPGPGPALVSSEIDKLVIVAKQDFYSKRAYDAFNEASTPKILKEYSGFEHAQNLFNGEHRSDLIDTLLHFLELDEK